MAADTMCATLEDVAGLAGTGGVIGADNMDVCNLSTLFHDQTGNLARSLPSSTGKVERDEARDSYARKGIPAARQLFEMRAACLLFIHIWRAWSCGASNLARNCAFRRAQLRGTLAP